MSFKPDTDSLWWTQLFKKEQHLNMKVSAACFFSSSSTTPFSGNLKLHVAAPRPNRHNSVCWLKVVTAAAPQRPDISPHNERDCNICAFLRESRVPQGQTSMPTLLKHRKLRARTQKQADHMFHGVFFASCLRFSGAVEVIVGSSII